MDSLKGRLLISSAGLYDPNFRHTVILVGEHDETGAAGVVLNVPLDTTVQDTVPALADLVAPGALLFQGGPVDPRQAVLLVEASEPGLPDMPVFGSVGFLTGEIPEEVRPHILRARVFLGHAGWGPGQLESELRAESWIVEEAAVDDVFSEQPESLWARVLKRKGPPYTTMATIPYDPSMN